MRHHTPTSSRGSSAPSTPPLSSILTPDDRDVFKLAPTVALTLLARSIEVLVSFTGDVPPTPPLSVPSSPELTAVHDNTLQSPSDSPNMDAQSPLASGFAFPSEGADDVDGVKVKKRRAQKLEEEEEGKFIAAGVDNAIQYGAITRKFWSKSVPEIPIEEYIFRIHRFCPMSTAVYIAASVYLHRLAVIDRVLPITRYNVHRLVLAALRVASKSLEDLSHSHKRFAKVGGLSENELSRLEVSFCFLVNFELNVDKATMERQVQILRAIAARQVMLGTPAIQPRMPKEFHRPAAVLAGV
ncbi:cyclin-domain-containing protein [Kalaharituber pfeilii]|nr:cyclin-domain-containing protein [Kalaharituber pfeilii]